MIFAPELQLYEASRQLIAAYMHGGSHGLLLSGKQGIGLRTIAGTVASAKNNSADGVLIIEPIDNKDITIEQIRELYGLTHSRRTQTLTVIIDDAERMGIPAQNALLKLLEEPPQNVLFVLAAHRPAQLLPTILSRVDHIMLRPITSEQSRELIKTLGQTEPTTVQQLLFLADGLPAQLTRLSRDSTLLAEHATLIQDARTLLSARPYERLIAVRSYMTDRDKSIQLLETIGRLLMHSSKQTVQARVVKRFALVSETLDRLTSNANVRLQLLHLALSM